MVTAVVETTDNSTAARKATMLFGQFLEQLGCLLIAAQWTVGTKQPALHPRRQVQYSSNASTAQWYLHTLTANALRPHTFRCPAINCFDMHLSACFKYLFSVRYELFTTLFKVRASKAHSLPRRTCPAQYVYHV